MMKHLICLCVLVWAFSSLSAQYTYTIKADSVKITNCDSSELIIENHTQNVPGFLYNTGRGRTIFKRGALKLNDSLYLVGADTIKTQPKAWIHGGNAFGVTGILGTLDNNHLDFYTNDSLRGRWTNTGNLLLGTSIDNGSKLNIKGGVFQDGGVYRKNYYTDVDHAFMAFGSGYELYGVPHSAGGYHFYISGGLSGDFDGGWDLAFGNSTNQIMLINSGQISTIKPLYVNGSIVFPEQSSYQLSPYVGFKYVSSTGWNWAVVNSNNTPNLIVTYRNNTVVGGPGDNGNKFQVYGNGYFNNNVGIGIDSATAQLHTTGTVRFAGLTSDTTKTRILVSDVNGNLFYRDASTLAANETIRSSLAVNGPISARKLTLSAHDWPDYVFDSAYQLLPLPHLEKYIQQHNHLPGIPSAATVERSGTDVGETQAALLKKIEELTLYAIEQDRKLADQGSKLEDQKQTIKALVQEVQELKELVKGKIKN